MEQIEIFNDLYLFRSMNESIGLTFNQYLLLGAEPVLFHAGSAQHAVHLVPRIKAILGEKALAYVFISHFESDECGGLRQLLEQFPTAQLICSPVTARQFNGFGLAYDLIVKNPGDYLETADYKLEFISYPSEMHLWEGLLAFETQRQIFFSSDLFMRRGLVPNLPVQANWEQEVTGITAQQIPSPDALHTLQEKLRELSVKYIAVGHGAFLDVQAK